MDLNMYNNSMNSAQVAQKHLLLMPGWGLVMVCSISCQHCLKCKYLQVCNGILKKQFWNSILSTKVPAAACKLELIDKSNVLNA